MHTIVIGDATFVGTFIVISRFWSVTSRLFKNRFGMAVNFAGTLWFSTVKQITELISPPSSESPHIKGWTDATADWGVNFVLQTSPLTVTLDRLTPRLQWHFLGPQKELSFNKKCWIEWHPAYSDTFLLSRGCHYKWGSLYFSFNLTPFKVVYIRLSRWGQLVRSTDVRSTRFYCKINFWLVPTQIDILLLDEVAWKVRRPLNLGHLVFF